MNRLAAVFSTFLILTLLTAPAALAQPGQHGMRAHSDSMRGARMGMMHEGMMQGMHGMHRMMQNPMHRSSMIAFMLPTLADTLGLNEAQTSQLNALKDELMTQHREQRRQMRTRRQELMGLFDDGEQPAPEAVRQQLTAMAELWASQRAALYETAQQMRQVLTDEQRQRLDGLSPRQQMRQMMANMPMMDMMRMMRMMRPMHGRMKHGGMMHGDRPGRGQGMQRHR